MNASRLAISLLAAAAILVPLPVRGDPVGTVKESGQTAADATRDGALTVGRTTRDFVEHGPHTAKRTWKANAARTKSDVQRDWARTKAEARSEK